MRSYEQEFGGTLTPGDQSLIRTAALLALKCEEMQSAVVRGESVCSDEIVRMADQLHRILADLKRRRGPRTSLLGRLAAGSALIDGEAE